VFSSFSFTEQLHVLLPQVTVTLVNFESNENIHFCERVAADLPFFSPFFPFFLFFYYKSLIVISGIKVPNGTGLNLGFPRDFLRS
jgi:hypothetical protein